MKIHFFLFISMLFYNLNAQNELDFWVGNWNVYSAKDNSLAGKNSIQKINTTYSEHWKGVNGFEGTSFTLLVKSNQKWQQTWVDNTNNQIDFQGHFTKDTLHLFSSKHYNSKGVSQIQKMQIIKVNDTLVHQIGKLSYDDGKTWQLNYFLLYKKLPQTEIKKILKADDVLGKKRNQDCKTISLSETILKYTTELKKLDLSHCSSNFKAAFYKHIEAWEAMISITDKYPNLRGEMHQLFKQIETKNDTEFKSKLANIWSTWDEIEKTI